MKRYGAAIATPELTQFCHSTCAWSLSGSDKTSLSAKLASMQILESTVSLFAQTVQKFSRVGECLLPSAINLSPQGLRLGQNVKAAFRAFFFSFQLFKPLQIFRAHKSRLGFPSRFQQNARFSIGHFVNQAGKSVFGLCDAGFFSFHMWPY